uniref:Uncharacterized protein n=1 Tax=Anguilla anguilla TaxID=7936 RepID=A0A0E9SGA0_ANGAN
MEERTACVYRSWEIRDGLLTAGTDAPTLTRCQC